MRHRFEDLFPRYFSIDSNCGLYSDRGFRLWVAEHPHIYKRLQSFLLKILSPHESFVDCGASFGWLTIPIASRIRDCRGAGRVLAVEARKKTCVFLNMSLRKNGLQGLVKVADVFVADAEGIVDFYSCSASGMSAGYLNEHLKHISQLRSAKLSIQTTRSTTVDLLVRESGLSNIGAVKVDIEGAELPALKGCRELMRTNDSVVFIVELNPVTASAAGYTVQDIWTFFKLEGFHIYTFDEGSPWHLNLCNTFQPDRLISSEDIVAVRNPRLLHKRLGKDLAWD